MTEPMDPTSAGQFSPDSWTGEDWQPAFAEARRLSAGQSLAARKWSSLCTYILYNPKIPNDQNPRYLFHSSDHIYRLLAPGNGFGKALCHGEKVLTTAGYRPIEQLRVGDRVFGRDGRTTAITHVWPQGKRSCLRFVFNDNTSVVCDRDHLWTVQLRNNRVLRPERAQEYGQWQTLSASEILRRVGPAPKAVQRPVIPSCQPVEFESRPVPIDPYVLGLLLGDGGLTRTPVRFSKPDAEPVVAIAYHYPMRKVTEDDWDVYEVHKELRALGLHGLRSHEKFIPECYLLNSVEVRRALLRGLMDIDGYAGCDKHKFSTSSPKLAEQFQFLVETLGGTCTVSDRIPRFTHKGERREGKRNWRISVWMPFCPFRMKRKAEKWRPTQTQPGRILYRIEEAGEHECTCITVADPEGLFLADHCIVTHNSASAAVEVDYWMRDAHPLQATPKPPIVGLWVAKKYQQFDIHRRKLEQWWEPSVPANFNDSKKRYTWPNGSALYLISGDSDWESVQGIEPDLVVIDEECPEPIWRELQMRRRAGTKTRYVITATATAGLRWMYRDLYKPWLEFHERRGIDETAAMLLQKHDFGDTEPALRGVHGIWCWPRGGVADNPVASEEDLALYRTRQFKSEAERQVRLYGGFRDFSGTPVFNLANLERMRQQLEQGISGSILPAR